MQGCYNVKYEVLTLCLSHPAFCLQNTMCATTIAKSAILVVGTRKFAKLIFDGPTNSIANTGKSENSEKWPNFDDFGSSETPFASLQRFSRDRNGFENDTAPQSQKLGSQFSQTTHHRPYLLTVITTSPYVPNCLVDTKPPQICFIYLFVLVTKTTNHKTCFPMYDFTCDQHPYSG